MGNWCPTVKLEPIEFDGDVVSVEASRLLVEDMADLMKNVDPVSKKLRFDDPSQVCSMASRLLPKYVKSFSGYIKADGTAMTREEFVAAASEFYFVPLVGRIFAALMAESTVGGAQAKNSVPPSQG